MSINHYEKNNSIVVRARPSDLGALTSLLRRLNEYQPEENGTSKDSSSPKSAIEKQATRNAEPSSNHPDIEPYADAFGTLKGFRFEGNELNPIRLNEVAWKIPDERGFQEPRH